MCVLQIVITIVCAACAPVCNVGRAFVPVLGDLSIRFCSHEAQNMRLLAVVIVPAQDLLGDCFVLVKWLVPP